MFVQPEDMVVENVGKEDRTKLTLAKPMEIKELAAEQHKIQIYKTAKRGLPTVQCEFDVKPQTHITNYNVLEVRFTHWLAWITVENKYCQKIKLSGCLLDFMQAFRTYQSRASLIII